MTSPFPSEKLYDIDQRGTVVPQLAAALPLRHRDSADAMRRTTPSATATGHHQSE
ncbi:hypothetical protein [Streptomyces formicae]|uniref:Uncharacterized protein n=1 Tax=Streptomyces formicae TaxID=1616117 RepID=A0ABY3WIF0_9ACTN|nr:hypothetical protein [Streptomyces formicae]UNM12377.1 hypothetical protein J4032_13250 [Streptomyces formicae]